MNILITSIPSHWYCLKHIKKSKVATSDDVTDHIFTMNIIYVLCWLKISNEYVQLLDI